MMDHKGYGQYLVSLPPAPQQNVSGDEDTMPFSKAVIAHELIGVVSMRYGRLPSAPTFSDVGYSISEKAQGRGYATEAAKALIG
jgi:RimJ/RimL family protein N-acetyltransferase